MTIPMNLKIFLCIFVLVHSLTSFSKERVITETELAEHASSQSCWIVVDDSVYDLTEDLEQHRKHRVGLEEFCGKNGTEAWYTKGSVKKPHSKKAELFLKKSRIGSWEK